MRRGIGVLLALAALAVGPSARAGDDLGALGRMSLEELSSVVVTSVSKAPEPLSGAAASVYVITREELLRSGATTLPEALRLAPNLQVAQSSAYGYAIAPRGLAGNVAAQNFPNKLLVLIDGRSVWSPLFSGVYWASQDVTLEDVERIEVISGPGATLWGANAFNGVINVITRSAAQTPGALLGATAGTRERVVLGRYGASLPGGVDARIYVKGVGWDAFDRVDGTSAQDDGRTLQAGFRADWTAAADALTVSGDVRREWLGQAGPPDELRVRGANVVGRWRRTLSPSSDLQLQAYVDEVNRGRETDGVAFRLRTYDLQLQHTLAIGTRQRLVWGAGERATRYAIDGTPTLAFVPGRGTLWLGNLFAQDTIVLAERLKLSLGLKLERDPYASWTPQPDVRLAWTPRADMLWWAAASRAIRAATPFDVDVVERLGPVGLNGNKTFRPERVDAYELGYRGQPAAYLSLAITGFCNDYHDLRTIEPFSRTQFFPIAWGNGLGGHACGVDAWASWQVTERWRLSPGFRWLDKRLRFAPGASGIIGVAQAGLDPRAQASLKSSLAIGTRFALDAVLRYQGAVDEARLPLVANLDLRLGWQASPTLDLALVGRNLLHAGRVESPQAGAEPIERAATVTARWSF